jgi:hypothetical protein
MGETSDVMNHDGFLVFCMCAVRLGKMVAQASACERHETQKNNAEITRVFAGQESTKWLVNS